MRKYIPLIAPFLILLAGLVAYVNSFGGVFILDDMGAIIHNKNIDSPILYICHSTRPLTALSFYVNHRISGAEAADYHLVNLIIHLLNSLLLYGSVLRTLSLPSMIDKYGKYRYLTAFFASLLWVVHPVQTESVTYIVQRAESLMGMFYLLTLYCSIRGFNSERPSLWLSCAVAACALGMMAKPIMVTAPLMALLYDRTFCAGSFRASVNLRKWFYVVLWGTLIIAAFLVLRPNESSASTGFDMKQITPSVYLATQQTVILHYLKFAFMPVDLCFDYAWPPVYWKEAVLPAMVIFTLVAVSIVLLRVFLP